MAMPCSPRTRSPRSLPLGDKFPPSWDRDRYRSPAADRALDLKLSPEQAGALAHPHQAEAAACLACRRGVVEPNAIFTNGEPDVRLPEEQVDTNMPGRCMLVNVGECLLQDAKQAVLGVWLERSFLPLDLQSDLDVMFGADAVHLAPNGFRE